jgi:long-chain acyl-CoA synthetase
MQTTFPRLLLNHAAQRPRAPAMREKAFGIWQALTWADLAVLVEHLACGLHQAGLRQGAHMVVLGANRPRLYATMLAVQSLGAIPYPCTRTLPRWSAPSPSTTPKCALRLPKTRSRSTSCWKFARSARNSPIFTLTIRAACALTNMRALLSVDDLVASGKAFASLKVAFYKAQVDQVEPDDVGAMFFTSGTTGNPRAWCIPTTPC